MHRVGPLRGDIDHIGVEIDPEEIGIPPRPVAAVPVRDPRPADLAFPGDVADIDIGVAIQDQGAVDAQVEREKLWIAREQPRRLLGPKVQAEGEEELADVDLVERSGARDGDQHMVVVHPVDGADLFVAHGRRKEHGPRQGPDQHDPLAVDVSHGGQPLARGRQRQTGHRRKSPIGLQRGR